jgi:hypothetical protein
VPRLTLKTEEEKRRFKEGLARRKLREALALKDL